MQAASHGGRNGRNGRNGMERTMMMQNVPAANVLSDGDAHGSLSSGSSAGDDFMLELDPGRGVLISKATTLAKSTLNRVSTASALAVEADDGDRFGSSNLVGRVCTRRGIRSESRRAGEEGARCSGVEGWDMVRQEREKSYSPGWKSGEQDADKISGLSGI
jgi:hypothetical protein